MAPRNSIPSSRSVVPRSSPSCGGIGVPGAFGARTELADPKFLLPVSLIDAVLFLIGLLAEVPSASGVEFVPTVNGRRAFDWLLHHVVSYVRHAYPFFAAI